MSPGWPWALNAQGKSDSCVAQCRDNGATPPRFTQDSPHNHSNLMSPGRFAIVSGMLLGAERPGDIRFVRFTTRCQPVSTGVNRCQPPMPFFCFETRSEMTKLNESLCHGLASLYPNKHHPTLDGLILIPFNLALEYQVQPLIKSWLRTAQEQI